MYLAHFSTLLNFPDGEGFNDHAVFEVDNQMDGVREVGQGSQDDLPEQALKAGNGGSGAVSVDGGDVARMPGIPCL